MSRVSTRSRFLVPMAAILICLLLVSTALAAVQRWGTNGKTICGAAGDQVHPEMVSDGQGGAIVAWHDERGADDNIYAQRVDAGGAGKWTANGVVICNAAGDQDWPQLVADGSGGAVIIWEDPRSGGPHIFAQRVNSSGAVQWAANGVLVDTDVGNTQSAAGITTDGSGGAIVGWTDSSGPNDIYAQHMDSGGNRKWGATGKAVCTAAGLQRYPEAVSDGSGGAVFAWYDYRSGGGAHLYAQKADASGTMKWTANGVQFCNQGDSAELGIVTDSAGGAIMAWADDRSGNFYARAQRVTSAGSAAWTANGIRLSSAANGQSDPKIVADGSGGAVVAWEDGRLLPSKSALYAQRINSSGAGIWKANGVQVMSGAWGVDDPDLVSDGSDGAIVAWDDQRTALQMYAQSLTSSGLARWKANGEAVFGPASDMLLQAMVPDGYGGAIIVAPAEYGGATTFDLYAQRMSTDYFTWYLAEGSTDWGFSTYITIENPNSTAVTAEITYQTDSGEVPGDDVSLPPNSQTVINPADKLGSKDFSTKVKCSQGKMIAVDRTMRWTGAGAASEEAHSSVGVTSPATTWYLAEGSSAWGFECWLLIQTPNGAEASCTITYMIEGEGPQSFDVKVGAGTRKSFNMAEAIGSKDASIKVTSDLPVIPARAMYRNSRREGHDSIGTTAPATDYYLAEGTSAWGFTTYVLVQNPNDEACDVTVTYMTEDGAEPQAPFPMEANSRKTIRVNDALPNKDFSTQVTGTRPIIAERAMYWTTGTGEACHDSIGMASPHQTFYLPDGETSNGRETWTLVQNPNSSTVSITVTYMTPTGSGNKTFTDTIPANSRKTYNMADEIAGGRAAIMVKCTTTGKKIMAERAVYWNSKGAGTETIGGYAD